MDELLFESEKKYYRYKIYFHYLFVGLLVVLHFLFIHMLFSESPHIYFLIFFSFMLVYANYLVWFVKYKETKPVLIYSNYFVVHGIKIPMKDIFKITYYGRFSIYKFEYTDNNVNKKKSVDPILMPEFEELEKLLKHTNIRLEYGSPLADSTKGLLYKSGLQKRTTIAGTFLLIAFTGFIIAQIFLNSTFEDPLSEIKTFIIVVIMLSADVIVVILFLRKIHRPDFEIYADRISFSDDKENQLQFKFDKITLYVNDIDHYNGDTGIIMKDKSEYLIPVNEVAFASEIIEKTFQDIGIKIIED